LLPDQRARPRAGVGCGAGGCGVARTPRWAAGGRAGERTDVLLSHRSLGACLKL